MIEFKLPSLGSDMDQGKLLEWKVKPGDRVKRGDVIALVDTSKAAVDVEIWDEGTVHQLLTQPGDTVPVGALMATLLAPGESPVAVGVRPASAPAPLTPPQPSAAPTSAPVEAAVSPSVAPAPGTTPSRRRVSPAARKHAEELGIDLDSLAGTGPSGAVTLEDVEHAAKAKRAPPSTTALDKATEMRRAIAAAMSRSKREIPHYYLSDVVPLRAATHWLQTFNEQRPMAERVLMAALFVKAVALACKRVPEVNGYYREGRFWPSEAVHTGVAVALRQGGLIAPAIHDVGRKSVSEVMRDLTDLVARARAGSLRSSEMSDPTITVTNLGDQGVESVFGVIYPPQVALVGFGSVTQRVTVDDGAVRIAHGVTASLAADHRVSDGHRGALFLAEIRRLLQEPALL